MKYKTYIIAEAGVNHNGSVDLAKKMIEVAADAGADAVKFQTFKAEKLLCRDTPKAQYQQQSTEQGESLFEMIKKLELDIASHKDLFAYCRDKNIQFLSSPFDLESIDFLAKLGLEIFKIPSGEINNFPYLKKIGTLGKQVILSTGMSALGEIEDALDVLTSAGTRIEMITVLHCNSEYPTPMSDVNLRAIQTISKAFGAKVGYSDHTLGIEVPIAAVALGASVIEKHFTLDRCLPGPDHQASAEPDELKAMVAALRNVEKAMGLGTKKPSRSELKNKIIARKSIVAAKYINKNEAFTENNITVKRPGTGISPMEWEKVIGKIAKKHFKEDEFIEL